MLSMAVAVMAIAGIFFLLAWACCAAAKCEDDACTKADEEIKALQAVTGHVSRAAVGRANVVSLQT